MADPELRSDEKVLLRTPGVYVKSIPFEGILTNRRIILVDRAKNLLPPKEIPLSTVRDAEPGENAIRDQIISLSVLAKTGETRQMILTFSRQTGGNRIKERDAWTRLIKEYAVPSVTQVVRKITPEPETVIRRSEPVARPRYEVVRSPAPSPEPDTPVRRQGTGTRAPPVSASLPATIYCSKCGSRLPAESVFCNRCGSPTARAVPPASGSGQGPVTREAAPAPVPVEPVQPGIRYTDVPAAAPAVPETVPAAHPEPVIVRAPASRPIDEEIRSIEPLIERSTENIPNDALSTETVKNPFEEEVTWDDQEAAAVPNRIAEPVPVPVMTAPEPETAPAPSPVSQPEPVEDIPLPPRPPRGGGILPARKTLVNGAVAVIAIILVVAGAFFVLPAITGGDQGTGTITTAPTPSATTTPSTTGTIKERPAAVVPATGVYVRVSYLGGFKGSYGMPDMLTTVPGNSGDRVWEVENANGTVDASFEKLDGSSHELVVEILKDGKVLTKGSTTVGHGSVSLEVNTTTGVASPPVSSGSGTAVKTTTAPASATTARTTVPASSTTTPAT